MSTRFALLALLSIGCHHSVNLRVLEPADVALPAEVQRIAVLDRHGAAGPGQAVMDVIEGALTGEAIQMDREGARAAVMGVVERLQDSPRFDAVVPVLDRDRFPPDIFSKPLDDRQVREICRITGTQAVVALDAFDSDSTVTLGSRTEMTTDSHGREIAVLVHEALRETWVVSDWRLYVPRDGVVDEVRDLRRSDSWTSEARTQAAAIAGLMNPWDTARVVGSQSGRTYGARIAPTWVWIGRTYYGAGDPRLKEARRHVKADDWDGARTVWEGMIEDPDRKIRGRALYDLALAHEVAGELYPARRRAKEAAIELANGRSRDYIRQLEHRLADRARLNEQMAPPEPAPPPKPRPVHPSERPEEAPLAIPAETPAPAPAPPPPPAPGRVERPR